MSMTTEERKAYNVAYKLTEGYKKYLEKKRIKYTTDLEFKTQIRKVQQERYNANRAIITLYKQQQLTV